MITIRKQELDLLTRLKEYNVQEHERDFDKLTKTTHLTARHIKYLILIIIIIIIILEL